MRLLKLIPIILLAASMAIGQSWTPVSSPGGFNMVRDIAIDASGSNAYAAHIPSLLKTTDGGVNWTNDLPRGGVTITNPEGVNCTQNNGIVLVSNWSGNGTAPYFYYSQNGGTWTTPAFTSPATNNNKPRVIERYWTSSNMLIGKKYYGVNEKAIQLSVDGGLTWTNATFTPNTTIFDIATNGSDADPGDVAAAGSPTGTQTAKGLYYNTSYGNGTWTSRQTTIPWTAVAFYYNTSLNHNIEFAGTADGRIYSGNYNTSLTQNGFNYGTDTIRSIRIAVTTDQAGSFAYVVFVATDDAVYQSANGGASWTSFSSGMLDPGALCMDLYSPTPASSTYTLLTGSRGFINRVTNNTGPWTPIYTPASRNFSAASMHAYTSPAPAEYWIADSALSVEGTSSSGSMQTQRIDVDPNVFAARQVTAKNYGTPRYVFLAGTRNNAAALYLSQTNGSVGSFQFEYASFNGETPGTVADGIYIDPFDSTHVYVFGSFAGSNNLKRSLSSGVDNTWAVQPKINFASPRECTAFGSTKDPSDNIFYATQVGAGLWRTTDLGNGNWYQVGIGGGEMGNNTMNCIAVNTKNVPAGGQTVLYVGGVGGLWRTTSAGQAFPTFTRQYSATDVKRVIIDPRFTNNAASSNYIFFLTSDNKVYWSTNGGVSSTNVTGTLPTGVFINDLRSDAGDTTVFWVATNQGGYSAQLVGQPVNASPANNASLLPSPLPLLQWNAAVGNPSTYRVQISTTPAFDQYTIFEDVSGIGATQYQMTVNPGCGATVYWRVQATNSFGFGTWSNYTSFSLNLVPNNTVTLTAPSNGDQTIQYCTALSLTWSSSYAGPFHLQVSTDPNFGTTVVNQAGVSGYAYSFSGMACGTTYYWRVAANSCNGDGPWSSVSSFKAGSIPAAVTLSTPRNGDNPGCPPLTWQAPTGCPQTYNVQVATDANFTGLVVNVNNVSALSYPLTNLSGSTVYYWRVSATNCNGTGSWSAARSFTSAALPDIPDLTYPPQGTVGTCQNLVTGCTGLAWTGVVGATIYDIQLSSVGFTAASGQSTHLGSEVSSAGYNYSFTSTTTSFVLLNDTVARVHYYWRVRAEQCGVVGSWSDPSDFTVNSIPCACKIEGPAPELKPKVFALEQNYPNPFNPATTLKYALPGDAQVSLRVFNVLGQQVAKLVDEFQTAGYKSVEFDASSLPSGLYFYRITAGTFTDIKKMMLVK